MTMQQTLTHKLNPNRFSAMSGKMAAIVGYIIDAPYTSPDITGLVVTSDGGVLASTSADPFMNEFIGHVSDLTNNLRRLAKAAELTKPERAAFLKLQRERIAGFTGR